MPQRKLPTSHGDWDPHTWYMFREPIPRNWCSLAVSRFLIDWVCIRTYMESQIWYIYIQSHVWVRHHGRWPSPWFMSYYHTKTRVAPTTTVIETRRTEYVRTYVRTYVHIYMICITYILYIYIIYILYLTCIPINVYLCMVIPDFVIPMGITTSNNRLIIGYLYVCHDLCHSQQRGWILRHGVAYVQLGRQVTVQ